MNSCKLDENENDTEDWKLEDLMIDATARKWKEKIELIAMLPWDHRDRAK